MSTTFLCPGCEAEIHQYPCDECGADDNYDEENRGEEM